VTEVVTSHDSAGRPLFSQETLAERAAHHVSVWAPRMKIAERITVKVETLEGADGGELDCALFSAAAVPESAGRWDFLIVVAPDFSGDDANLENAVRHELVHLLLEPLREEYFAYRRQVAIQESHIVGVAVERWETVIERIADAFAQGYREVGLIRGDDGRIYEGREFVAVD
jgi:hypothetical protein